MMKMMIIAFAGLVAVALAAPQHHEHPVVVVKETPSDNIGVGGYNFGYQLSNGETRQESAQVVNAGTDEESLAVTGSFSFVDQATNQEYRVNYVADQNGFRATGDHIPA